MKRHGAKSIAASTGCAPTMPTSQVGPVDTPRVVVETTDRNDESTNWLVAMISGCAELRDMLREEVAEAVESAHTASGRRRAMAFLGTMYRHSLMNHQLADRASEVGDSDVAIVASELQKIIDDVVIRLEEALATPPASSRSRRESILQLGVAQ